LSGKGEKILTNVVRVKNLEKSYGSKKALNGIDFIVKKGEILGLLGPNGAGKSTTINILSTVLSPGGGDIEILGYDLETEKKAIKQNIGIVPQDIAIYEEISAEKNVRFFASLYNIKGAQLDEGVRAALELVGLYDRRKEKPKTFSGGMRRRLNIACAIAHQPKLIIMDEPTVGIDPQSRNHILESIKILKEKDSTIIYSTHYMEEVEAISDRIIIMNEGDIIAEGTKEELNKKVNNEITYTFQISHKESFDEEKVSDIQGVKKIRSWDNTVEIRIDKLRDPLSEVILAMISNGCRIVNMNSREASLETVFLELTGKNLRD
jgi:ABC-2 type transport system ATP-binding protein